MTYERFNERGTRIGSVAKRVWRTYVSHLGKFTQIRLGQATRALGSTLAPM